MSDRAGRRLEEYEVSWEESQETVGVTISLNRSGGLEIDRVTADTSSGPSDTRNYSGLEEPSLTRQGSTLPSSHKMLRPS